MTRHSSKTACTLSLVASLFLSTANAQTCNIGGQLFQAGQDVSSVLQSRCQSPGDFPCYCNPNLDPPIECPFCTFTQQGGGLLCATDDQSLTFTNLDGVEETCSCNIPIPFNNNPQTSCQPAVVQNTCEIFVGGRTQSFLEGQVVPITNRCIDSADGDRFDCFCNPNAPSQIECPFCRVSNSDNELLCMRDNAVVDITDTAGDDVTCECDIARLPNGNLNAMASCSPRSVPPPPTDAPLPPTDAPTTQGEFRTTQPTVAPTNNPRNTQPPYSESPATAGPTTAPTSQPVVPTNPPTVKPTTPRPTDSPTVAPIQTLPPTQGTMTPTNAPITVSPTHFPTAAPATTAPTRSPQTLAPTAIATSTTSAPTTAPTATTITQPPTSLPTTAPTQPPLQGGDEPAVPVGETTTEPDGNGGCVARTPTGDVLFERGESYGSLVESPCGPDYPLQCNPSNENAVENPHCLFDDLQSGQTVCARVDETIQFIDTQEQTKSCTCKLFFVALGPIASCTVATEAPVPTDAPTTSPSVNPTIGDGVVAAPTFAPTTNDVSDPVTDQITSSPTHAADADNSEENDDDGGNSTDSVGNTTDDDASTEKNNLFDEDGGLALVDEPVVFYTFAGVAVFALICCLISIVMVINRCVALQAQENDMRRREWKQEKEVHQQKLQRQNSQRSIQSHRSMRSHHSSHQYRHGHNPHTQVYYYDPDEYVMKPKPILRSPSMYSGDEGSVCSHGSARSRASSRRVRFSDYEPNDGTDDDDSQSLSGVSYASSIFSTASAQYAHSTKDDIEQPSAVSQSPKRADRGRQQKKDQRRARRQARRERRSRSRSRSDSRSRTRDDERRRRG